MRGCLITLAVVALLAGIGFALRVLVFPPAPVSVRVIEAGRGRVEETVTNSRAGTVRASRRAKLSPEIGGKVVEVPFREGEQVSAGEIVLRLDDGAQKARLELARRDAEAAAAERERACLAAERTVRELQRMQRLADDQIVSADLLDQVSSASESAEAGCRAARAGTGRALAAVNVARSDLEKTVLRSPFSGIVAEVSIEVGEWTTPSPPALPVPAVIDVLDPSSIYISAPMDEVDSGRVRGGLPTRVTVDSYRDRVFEGTVRRVAPYVLDVQEQNRTVEIEVELADAEIAERLLPGTSADVEIIVSVREDVLRIPTSSLIEGGKVMVLEDGMLVEKRVEIGLRNWDLTEITDGLAEGESVVLSLDRPEVKAGAEAAVEEEDPGA